MSEHWLTKWQSTLKSRRVLELGCGAGLVAADGGFELLAGRLTEAQVRAWDGARELERFTARSAAGPAVLLGE